MDVKGSVDSVIPSRKIDGRRQEIRDECGREAAETQTHEAQQVALHIEAVLGPFRDAVAPLVAEVAAVEHSRVLP